MREDIGRVRPSSLQVGRQRPSSALARPASRSGGSHDILSGVKRTRPASAAPGGVRVLSRPSLETLLADGRADVGESTLPNKWTMTASSPLPHTLPQTASMSWDGSTRQWSSTVFPSSVPVGRDEAVALRTVARKVLQDKKGEASEWKEGFVAEYNNVDTIFTEAIRQASTRCKEHGEVLEAVRSRQREIMAGLCADLCTANAAAAAASTDRDAATSRAEAAHEAEKAAFDRAAQAETQAIADSKRMETVLLQKECDRLKEELRCAQDKCDAAEARVGIRERDWYDAEMEWHRARVEQSDNRVRMLEELCMQLRDAAADGKGGSNPLFQGLGSISTSTQTNAPCDIRNAAVSAPFPDASAPTPSSPGSSRQEDDEESLDGETVLASVGAMQARLEQHRKARRDEATGSANQSAAHTRKTSRVTKRSGLKKGSSTARVSGRREKESISIDTEAQQERGSHNLVGGEQQLQTKDVKWSATETGSKLDSGWTPVESPEPSPREVLIAAGSELNMRDPKKHNTDDPQREHSPIKETIPNDNTSDGITNSITSGPLREKPAGSMFKRRLTRVMKAVTTTRMVLPTDQNGPLLSTWNVVVNGRKWVSGEFLYPDSRPITPRALSSMIAEIYDAKLVSDESSRAAGKQPVDFRSCVKQLYALRHGLKSVSDAKLRCFVGALLRFRGVHPRVALASRLLGLPADESCERDPFPNNCLEMYLTALDAAKNSSIGPSHNSSKEHDDWCSIMLCWERFKPALQYALLSQRPAEVKKMVESTRKFCIPDARNKIVQWIDFDVAMISVLDALQVSDGSVYDSVAETFLAGCEDAPRGSLAPHEFYRIASYVDPTRSRKELTSTYRDYAVIIHVSHEEQRAHHEVTRFVDATAFGSLIKDKKLHASGKLSADSINMDDALLWHWELKGQDLQQGLAEAEAKAQEYRSAYNQFMDSFAAHTMPISVKWLLYRALHSCYREGHTTAKEKHADKKLAAAKAKRKSTWASAQKVVMMRELLRKK